MSNDDTLRSIGTTSDNARPRDAVHIAVVSMQSDYYIYPGEAVGLDVDAGKAIRLGTGKGLLGKDFIIGVADPFLDGPVPPGSHFWVFLTPGSITSLRHNWTHPAFPDTEASMYPDAVHRIADGYGVSPEKVIEQALLFDGNWETHGFVNHDIDYPTASDLEQLWAYLNSMGHKMRSKPGNFYSCAC